MSVATADRWATGGIGKVRRLRRMFSPKSGRTLIVPLDDGLIFGPFEGLENMEFVASEVSQGSADAVLSFPGTFRAAAKQLHGLSWIMNLTASTIGSSHTRKVIVGSVEQAVSYSADAVAVHVNCTDENEGEMLKALGDVVRESERFQMPVLAIMYPRRNSKGETDNYDELKANDPKHYARMVAHAARIGAELGADLIKTKYTGDADSFRTVVEAAPSTPIIIAGGELISREGALAAASGAIEAGAAGVCYGRNVYQRDDIGSFLSELAEVIHA